MDLSNTSKREEDDKSTDKSPDRLPGDLSSYPLFIWKSNFRKYFGISHRTFNQLFTPDIVQEMKIPAYIWRRRRKIYRRELLVVVKRLDVTVRELKEMEGMG